MAEEDRIRPESKGLVGRIGLIRRHDWPDFVSRDFAADLKCAATTCFLNTKSGYCSAPSAVSMDERGQCAIFVKQRDHEADTLNQK